MDIIELIKKQEAQSRIALTDEERERAVSFFTDREAEQDAFHAVNLRETPETTVVVPTVDSAALREDVAAADAERETFLSCSPDTDGCFVRVPRAL